MKYILFFVITFGYAKIGYCQQYLNLNFEKKSVEGQSRPWGWSLDSQGQNIFSLDSVNVKSGRYSLLISVDSLIKDSPALQHNLEPFFIKQKKVSLKGSVNSQLTRGKSYISVGYGKEQLDGDYSNFFTNIYEIGESTSGWHKFETSFFVPKDATTCSLKIGLEGQGEIRYDNLELIIDNEKFEEIPVAKTFSISELKEIKSNSVSFALSKNLKHKSSDFSFLTQIIGNSRIIALGESTHGTSEFFKLKHQVFKYAVNHLGFRVFALEDNQLACDKVNQYVLGKMDIDKEQAMSQLFAVWHTEEMKALIEWIRHFNIANPRDPVYFTGFDIQDYKLPLNSLKSYLKDKTVLLNELSGFEDFAKNIFNANDSIKMYWQEKTTLVYETLRKGISAKKHDVAELQNAKLLQQFTENALKGHWSLYRDEAMADNINWLANVKYPEEKIFVWAHDVHISKSYHPNYYYNLNNGVAMGSFLRKTFADDYKAFGLMTYSGNYLAQKSYTNYDKIAAPLYPAPKGSLEEALHVISKNLRENNLFLSFESLYKLLQRPIPIRFANHVNIDYGFWQRISLPYQFDGVFFIDHTTSSKYSKY